MYSTRVLAGKYIKYWLKASNGKGHGVHSPFVYDFVQHVLNRKDSSPGVSSIEQLRSSLKKNNTLLTLQDFGAGSSINARLQRTVASIAKNSLKPRKYAHLLYNMVRHYQPQTILEMGTCLGITTSYLAVANRNATVYTMEGAHEVASVALQNFSRQSLKNVEVIEGSFDQTLPGFIEKLKQENTVVDFVFIDGNHQQEPVLAYFNALKPLLGNDSVIIFDDIHWSAGMEAAWQKILEDESVTLSIDLFFIGIVFFKKECRVKQHFMIRY